MAKAGDTQGRPRRAVHHCVDERDVGERADVVLGRRIPALSRRQARALARAGKLRVDGRRSPPATRVELGAELVLELAGESEAEPIESLEILRVTERFVYVHKPAGVHTVALTPEQPGVLATAVARRFGECGEASPDPREGGAVHRLDRATSGVVAFARSREVWERAREGFGRERVAKHYLAVCEARISIWPPPLPEGGLPGWIQPCEPPRLPQAPEIDALVAAAGQMPSSRDGLWDSVRVRAPLGRGDTARRAAVRLDGRRASTRVQVLATLADRRLVALELETGRRHQARVHLAWIGLPIVGDPLYGSASEGTFLRLHALSIDLSAVFASEHPVLAPPPPNFL